MRTAAYRAYAFHNLAILSILDFDGLNEELFWRDIDWFLAKCPDDRHQYREIFERCLKGEPVNIVAPDAGFGHKEKGAAPDGPRD